ncbi:MAG: MFS transporter [Chloroflexota bacterium]|nr:MFS transporter [Chloroflexota bacterium]
MVTAIRRKLHYGWVIFALTFTNLTVEGGSKNVQAVFLVALRDHFRSSVAVTAAVFSASGLFGAFMAPFLGVFLDRFGPRVLFPLAGCLILVGWMASSFASEIWQLFIFYSVIATLGQVGISSFSATATLSPWFPRSKGVMLGTADAGNPTGQAIVVPLAQLIVSTWGWQWAYRVFGVAFFLLIALPNLLQKRPPAGHGGTDADAAGPGEEAVRPAVIGDGGAVAEVQSGSQIKETMKEPAVWCLCAARAVGAIGNQMTLVHMLAFLFLTGYGELQAAFAIGIAGLMGIGARPAIGLFSDIFGREVIYTLGMSLTVAGVLIVLFFSSGGVWWALVAFVALTGLSEGVGGLLLGAKAADIYPPRMLGTVMGVLEAGRGIGIGTGPILAGLLFDLQGDYFVAFLISAGLTVVSIFLMWGAGLAHRKKLRAVVELA